MREDLKSDVESIVEGRLSQLLNHLNKNPNYYRLSHKTKELRENLEIELDNEIWLKVKDLVRNYMLKCSIEGKYLYAQGILDCSTISIYLNSELIDGDFVDIGVDDF